MTEKGVSEPNSMGHTFQFKLHQCWSIEYSPKPWKWVMSVVVVMDGWHRTRLKSARWLHFLPMKIQKKMWNQGEELPLVDFEWIYHESMWNNTNKHFFGFLSDPLPVQNVANCAQTWCPGSLKTLYFWWIASVYDRGNSVFFPLGVGFSMFPIHFSTPEKRSPRNLRTTWIV